MSRAGRPRHSKGGRRGYHLRLRPQPLLCCVFHPRYRSGCYKGFLIEVAHSTLSGDGGCDQRSGDLAFDRRVTCGMSHRILKSIYQSMQRHPSGNQITGSITWQAPYHLSPDSLAHPIAPNRAPVQVVPVGRAVLNQKQNRSIGKAVSAAEGATAPLMSLCPVTYPAPLRRGLQAV